MADQPTIFDEINEISDVPKKNLGYLSLLVYRLDLPNPLRMLARHQQDDMTFLLQPGIQVPKPSHLPRWHPEFFEVDPSYKYTTQGNSPEFLGILTKENTNFFHHLK